MRRYIAFINPERETNNWTTGRRQTIDDCLEAALSVIKGLQEPHRALIKVYKEETWTECTGGYNKNYSMSQLVMADYLMADDHAEWIRANCPFRTKSGE